MSAVAHKSIDNTNIASVQLNTEPAVTSISVSARIDYIQRFSKQTVLVIDNDVDVYTQAARQFLINLSKEKSNQETNVAFVSASTKLNDIQMRCRLIEQLFANTLFDPEKSLAVSILQLGKKSKESLTIVVEHAHSLSLQMKYELCQLVDVANKTHSKINVVLFGQEQAAQDAATNKSIFKNKLAIVDAKTGQLFPLEHAKFNSDNATFTSKFWKKLMITLILISVLIGSVWAVMIEYDNFSLSQLPAVNVNESIKGTLEPVATMITTNDKELVVNEVLPKGELAKAAEIHAALLGEESINVNVENIRAQTADVLQALDFTETKIAAPLAVEAELQISKSEEVKPEMVKEIVPTQVINEEVNKLATIELPLVLTPRYYLNSPTGYVIQIVGFTDITLLARFTEQYPDLEYYSYQKKLNDQIFTVLTTRSFDSKEQAQAALQALPQTIIDRGVWIKALSTVQSEINGS